MSRTPARSRRGRARAGAAAVLAATAIAIGWTTADDPPALAASTPADAVVVATPPRSLTLTFTRRPESGHVSVSVAGRPVTAGGSLISGRNLTVPLAPATGDHLVAYHADFGSAGSVAGTVRFRVGGPGGSAAAPESADRPGHRHGGDLDPLTVGLLASAATGIAGGLLVMLRRGGRGGG